MIRVIVVVNGIQAAFDAVGRAKTSQPQACTSLSIYVIVGDEVVFHCLLDCGPGVPGVLVANDRFPRRLPDVLVLSHSHPDHFLGVDLLVGLRRRRWLTAAGIDSAKLKLICVRDTYEQTILKCFGHLAPHLDYQASSTLTPITLWTDGQALLRVTLVPVVHFRQSCVSVFEFVVPGRPIAKLVALFDFDRFHLSSSEEAALGATATNPLFARPDILIAEANTWSDARLTSESLTGHADFLALSQLIQMWMPQRTRILHYGAYEDLLGPGRPERYWELVHNERCIHPSEGPTSQWELTAAIQQHLQSGGFPRPCSVAAAYPSETLVLAPNYPSDELIVRVRREAGKLICAGAVSRVIAHEYGIPHTTVLLIPYRPATPDAPAQILIHRRSKLKKVSPNCLDFAGGHVDFSGSLQSPDSSSDPSVLAAAILETALREATEEIIQTPSRPFVATDLSQLGEIGEYTTGLDHPGQGNVEHSTAILVRLSSSNVSIRDTDSAGESVLESSFMTLADLLRQFEEQPEAFADGAARVLKRLANEPELRETLARSLERNST